MIEAETLAERVQVEQDGMPADIAECGKADAVVEQALDGIDAPYSVRLVEQLLSAFQRLVFGGDVQMFGPCRDRIIEAGQPHRNATIVVYLRHFALQRDPAAYSGIR